MTPPERFSHEGREIVVMPHAVDRAAERVEWCADLPFHEIREKIARRIRRNDGAQLHFGKTRPFRRIGETRLRGLPPGQRFLQDGDGQTGYVLALSPSRITVVTVLTRTPRLAIR